MSQKTLADLGKFIRGKGIPKRHIIQKNGRPCIRYAEIYTSYTDIAYKFISRISAKHAKKALAIYQGDIIFPTSGETVEEIGKAVAYLGSETAYAGGDTLVLREHGQDSAYLAYALNEWHAIKQKVKRATGGGVVHLYASELGQVGVWLPPLDEQKRIVEILSDADAAITTAEKISEKAFQALKRYRDKIFSVNSNWLGKKELIGEIFDIQTGRTPSRNVPEYWAIGGNDGHPWASISDLKQGTVFETSERISELGRINSNARFIPAGTVLMSFKLTIGRIAVSNINLYTNEAIAAFFPKNESLSSTHIKHALAKVDWLARTDQAVKGKTLNKKKIQESSIRLVKHELRLKAEKILTSAEEYYQFSLQQVNNLKKFKRGLMQQLLTGNIRVPGKSKVKGGG